MSADLVERLEKAEVGSREMDLAIWADHVAVPRAPRPASLNVTPPAYTTSLDAIVGLIGEKLPGWTWDAGDRFYGSDWDLAWARVYPHRHQGAGTGNVTAKTPPLALCRALLRALKDSAHDR